MSDLYFLPSWEMDHPYLAALWRKLLGSSHRRLVASVGQFELVLDHMGAGGRLLLSWEDASSHLVAADDLSSLFQEAVVDGLSFEINERSIPLECWL